MNILENVPLAQHSTMRLGGKAHYLAEATSPEEVRELVRWAKGQNLAHRIIGSGSNIVWKDQGFPGLIIVNKIMGREIISQDEVSITVRFGGGENWDGCVQWAVSQDFSGIEFMSFIPGTAGAAPVQNVGAYGSEISKTLKAVSAYDTLKDYFESLMGKDCHFSYRSSRFKTSDRGRFMITHVILVLHKKSPEPPFYESLQRYFDEHHIRDFTPATVRQAVIAIRKIRLPDPSVVANNGSFFTNPFVDDAKFKELQTKYPDIKGWSDKEGHVKLAAGWLVEKAGFREVHDAQTGMATWGGNALVMVNENAKSTADLLAFKQKILDKVQEMFGITLEQEPELLP